MKQSMQTKLGLLTLLVVTFFINGLAKASTLGNREIKCHTQNHEKMFTISEKFLTFHEAQSTNFLSKRAISSANPVRTKVSGEGIVQTLSFEGNNHKIVIKDLKKFSEMTDYLSIVSPKGHEMTYPITCEQLN